MSGFISLEDRIQSFDGDVVALLRAHPASTYPFPYAPEYASWPAEQWAWHNSCVLFDQTHHMSDIYFRGPDVKRLFSDFGVNSMKNFGRGRAKQFVGVAPDGKVIGDQILFGLEDDVYSLVGAVSIGNWMEYQARVGDYNVDVERDEATLYNAAGVRKLWRYQLNGPRTQDVIEKAIGGPLPDVPFFGMAEFEIAGMPVRALNHTMSGAPGERATGLELFGPIEHGPAVLDALMTAGAEYGLLRGGALSYLSTTHESGWIASPVPAVYTDPALKGYRESLFGFGFEASLMLDGSFASDNIEDYYCDPWALGYGSLVKFDHDFVGRDALEAISAAPPRRKVWLVWNDDDFIRVFRDGLFGETDRPRIISAPNAFAISQHFDSVLSDSQLVGVSGFGGYTVNIGHVATLGMIDAANARDGAEVSIVWGEPDGGAGRVGMEPHHVQTTVRATVSTRPPVRP